MLSYIIRNFCEPEKSRKVSSFCLFSRLCTTTLLAFTLMNSGIFAITSPLEESREYQRSLNEFMGNSSLPHHKTDKRFTPYWAAQIDGGENAAKNIAIKYGFTYLGEVSSFLGIFIQILWPNPICCCD